jgi:hypothetical protein
MTTFMGMISNHMCNTWNFLPHTERNHCSHGTPIRQQQRALITRLGIAHEGETIGDDALNAYLDLFTRPFRQQHLDVVLRLFGWTSDDLISASDAPVECLS